MRYQSSFDLAAIPVVQRCTGTCGHNLIAIPNGWIEKLYYCEKCDTVYTLKLVKLQPKKINQRVLRRQLRERRERLRE